MRVENALPPAYVNVRQLNNVKHLTIDGWFYGFKQGSFLRLSDNSWWRQTSRDLSTYTHFEPEILLWNDAGTDRIEMPDNARTVDAEQLSVLNESTITNDFTGLQYANIYQLDDDGDWLQTSTPVTTDDTDEPQAMLWAENEKVNLLARRGDDSTIGTCTVVDPSADADGDLVNNAEEAVAGTSLYDSEDFFVITDIGYDSLGRAVLRWESIPGRIYTAQWTPSLIQPFQTLENSITFPQDSWTDTINPPGSGGFYRINVHLAP